MKLHRIALALFAALPFAAACNSTQTAQNTNTNARPAATAAATTPTPAAASTPDELAAASDDYAKFCANCHKADGTGGPYKDETGHTMKVPSLREHGLKDPDSELAKQIAEGGDEMPPFGKRLDKQRIDNLVRYIRREYHGRTTTAPTTSAATPAQPSH